MKRRARVQRPGVRAGYDQWADSYDATPNPLVALDERYTLRHLAPRAGMRVLDAACGTGRNLARLADADTRPIGLDLSLGMLRRARRKDPRATVVQADLGRDLPLEGSVFDAVLYGLVGEHLTDLPSVFREARRVLVPEGRVIFSVFHPEPALAGVEANFSATDSSGEEVEVRLGAEPHRLEDYLGAMDDAGFTEVRATEYRGDSELAQHHPGAVKFDGRPLLLVCEGRRAG